MAGDVYVNQCGITTDAVAGAFCAERTYAGGGNIFFGPDAVPPTNPAPAVDQTIASCTAAAAGTVATTGGIIRQDPALKPPAFAPPTGTGPSAATTYSAAAATNSCLNGSPAVAAQQCFNPGVYTTITGIANNLNPGVYYVLGDPACNAATCTGVEFSGNTMNANWRDIKDRCWAAPSNPALGTFANPCPDGFAIDPTSATVVDPQCVAPVNPLPAPAFTLTPAGGGSLTPVTTKYFVRVTANASSGGETISSEQSIVIAGLGNSSFNVNITPVVGASSYNIYASAGLLTDITRSDETLQLGSVPAVPVNRVSSMVAGGRSYPSADSTACGQGFHNKPTGSGTADSIGSTNYGVTFVLFNKANFCIRGCTSALATPTVLLSPYCAAFASATTCPHGTSQDGSFVIYAGGASGVYPGSQGLIGFDGLGSKVGLAGTIYAPSMQMSITSALFELYPGQAFIGKLSAHSANTLQPLIYFPCCAPGNGLTGTGSSWYSTGTPPYNGGAPIPPGIRLIN